MKTRIITGSFGALSFEVRLTKAVPPRLEEHESPAAAMHSSVPRPWVELALPATVSFPAVPPPAAGAANGRMMKLGGAAPAEVLMRMHELTPVKQRLVSRSWRSALPPPAGLTSLPAGRPDFRKLSHDDESAHHR